MCKFFSAVSDGHGEVKFFTIEDIVREMAKGNPKSYIWNSHTSICQFFGIKSKDEDRWNKWEYDVTTKTLKADSLVTTDDSKSVTHYIEEYLKDKCVNFLRNLYGGNSGNGNSGNGNSGNGNSGSWNSGNGNSGNGNSGYWNSGSWNSGSWNSGSWNSGNWNSGDGILNSFCTKRQYILFDKICTEKDYEELNSLPWSWFELNRWISGSEMTVQEKADNKYWDITDGYLKTISYKEAWQKCPKEFIEKVKKLNNFDAEKFFEITGLKV